MECPFCEDSPDVEQWDEDILDHLIITIDANGHAHTHGPIEEPKKMEQLLAIARKAMGQTGNRKGKKSWGKKKPSKEPAAKA